MLLKIVNQFRKQIIATMIRIKWKMTLGKYRGGKRLITVLSANIIIWIQWVFWWVQERIDPPRKKEKVPCSVLRILSALTWIKKNKKIKVYHKVLIIL